MPNNEGELKGGQAMRIYSTEGKSVTLKSQAGGLGAKTGLYAVSIAEREREREHNLYLIPENQPESYLSDKMCEYAYKCGTKSYRAKPKCFGDKASALTKEQNKRAGVTNYIPESIENVEGEITDDGNAKNAKPIYKVENGQIEIKGKTFPVKLPDGFYIIRKLTVTECCRLQTMPDDYCKAVSNSQAYKALGNGWTAEVIIHLLETALKDVSRDEELVVLSMYDGIATGRYCLDKMGFTNVTYYAYEIDKYAIQVAKDNYPNIIECGDAFAVRDDDWTPPKPRSDWLDDCLE